MTARRTKVQVPLAQFTKVVPTRVRITTPWLVAATFDYDTYGRTYDPDANNGLASGTKKEHALTAYGYTGMRKRDSAGTTNHHARDYNAASRMWLQTDQYADPWRDLGLSLNSGTRNRHSYAMGNPVGRADRNGHFSWTEADGTTGCLGFCPVESDETQRPVGTTIPESAGPKAGGGSTLTSPQRNVLDVRPSNGAGSGERYQPNIVSTIAFVRGASANGWETMQGAAQTAQAACATNALMGCTVGLSQMVGEATANCVNSAGVRGCGNRVYGAGKNYVNACRNAIGNAYALGRGCGGDAGFTLLGGMGTAKFATRGVTVYRLHGGGSRKWGQSWTTVDPRTMADPRADLGLPSANNVTSLTVARATRLDRMTARSALPLDGQPGGAPEFVFRYPEADLVEVCTVPFQCGGS